MGVPLTVRAFAIAIVSGVATAQMGPPPGGLGMMSALMRADADHDGVVTRAEVGASANATFDRLDTNHDGIVTPDEMAAGRPMRAGNATPPPPPGAADRAAPPPRTPPPPPPPHELARQQWRGRALAQFDRADANHDGRVDQAEMQAWRDAMHARRQERFGRAAPPPPPPGD